jgi:hypothetical protein
VGKTATDKSDAYVCWWATRSNRKNVSAPLRDESERLRAEVSRLQARVDELEGLVSRIAAQCGEVLGKAE